MTGMIALPIVSILLASLSATADADAPSHEIEAAEGFEVELFAADPNIAKPIQMTFDDQGRLWVATSRSYPQLEPGAEPNDQIYVLEDTDGDGKADKSTVFADGLLMPTGIAVGDGGVYVGHSTEVLHLSDTDGDGKADRTRVVLSGFGTEDTHHLVHTFRWGPGGALHFAQSIYIHSHVETPWGVHRLNGGGFWMYRPGSHRLDVLVRGMVNSWGIAFDNAGQAFGVDNDHDSVKYFLPGARLRFTPGEKLILQGLVSDKPKYCGAEIIASRHFPDDWQGDLITCDFRAHRVCRYKLTEDGAGFAAKELEPLLSSEDITFRPIDVKLGPDGALYVCDWYNPIINHGEVDFRDPRRDKTHGRIWRVVRKDRELAPKPDFANASIDELLTLQTSPEKWSRLEARRALLDHPREDVRKDLGAWVAKQSDDLLKLRGLWTYQTLEEVELPLLESLLDSKNPEVRAAAVRVLSDWHDRVPETLKLLTKRVGDDHPRVRMEAVRALAKLQRREATKLALTALDQPTDRFLDYALKLTSRETAPHWLPTLQDPSTIAGLSPESARHWTFALLALDHPSAAGPLLQLWRKGLIPPEDLPNVLSSLSKHGGPSHLRAILDEIVSSESESVTTDAQRAQLLATLASASKLRRVKPDGDLSKALTGLLGSPEANLRKQACLLAALWNVEALWPRVRDLAASSDAKPAVTAAAIEALGVYGGKRSAGELEKIVATSTKPQDRLAALRALVPLAPKNAARLAVPLLTKATNAAEAKPVFEAFLSHRRGPAALAEGLGGNILGEEVAREGINLVSVSGQVAPGLVGALTKAGSLPDTARTLSKEQLAKLVAQARRQGNPHRGQKIYQREKLNCVKCHAIRGTGGKVGPDLTTIGASAPLDYLIESLLLPGAKVKENYHSMTIVTADGDIVTGIPVRKTNDQVVLRNGEDKLITIATADIDESKLGGSLMPVGLTDSLQPQEFLDLVRYLGELGKPGPFGPTEQLTARTWRLLGPFTKQVGDELQSGLIAGATPPPPRAWRPTSVTNAGWVSIRNFALNPDRPVLYGSVDVDVTKPGKFALALEPIAGPATVWLDGKPIAASQSDGKESTYNVELSKGVHRLLVRMDLHPELRFLKARGFPLDPDAELRFTIDAER
ncbi:HEAT repeat protein [Planctomycetes bacterium Pan216]|uniref:HEAT repeat protein n=1 Tax=Kolteria novifilia TaxID=2527975 RepID=A0A518BBP8_9BACT|nr:HEAT repeat protein [Planctomycetes bacterium Pan216]